MVFAEKPVVNDLDVLIVGAGISGINAAYRVQTKLPTYSYAILEGRDALGGTWDLFRYPGIRSDSDLHTFGFPWRPWQKPNAIADGESIRTYMKESASMYGIDRKIRYRHKMLAGDWSTANQRWSVSVDANGEKKTLTAKFLIMGTGYYDYNEPLKADIPGLTENFRGQIIHPQFWPEDLDYTGKKIVVIGSGATAITLIPNLVDKAESVTMLQRSPTYIVALPQRDVVGDTIRKYLPGWLAHQLVRIKFLVLPFLFFQFCRSFPDAARRSLARRTKEQLPADRSLSPDFTPLYNPWDQRLCVCPDGDFFRCLRAGTANVVTDTISTVTASGIETSSGKTLPADIIVTATGLKMQMAGGAKLTVDQAEEPVQIGRKFLWKGVMLQDLPNAAFVIGYTNASWTLGADATATLLVRLMRYMERNGLGSAVPRVAAAVSTKTGEEDEMKPSPALNLKSTYILKGKDTMPQAGDRAPWLPRVNYLLDYPRARWGGVTDGLVFEKAVR